MYPDELFREFDWKTRGAQRLLCAADLVKGREPSAEDGCILLPAWARMRLQKTGRIETEQTVCVHGHLPNAVTGAFEQRCARAIAGHDIGPERLLLQSTKHHTIVSAALLPRGAQKSIPVLDMGCGPCGKSLSAARAVIGRAKRTCGTLAGCDDAPAGAQPCVDFCIRIRGGV